MGAFIGYYGTPVIPEDKKEEVIRQMDTIMRIGGMMSMETAEMFGHKIDLLVPVSYDEKGEADFYINYLSNEFWEDVCFRKEDCRLYSGKMGGGIFSDVLSAMYYLIEMNSVEDNLVARDIAYGNREFYIGWINHICNAKYIDDKSYLPWKIVEMLHGSKDNESIYRIIREVITDNTFPFSLFESIYVIDSNRAEMLVEENDEDGEQTNIVNISSIIKKLKKYFDISSNTLDENIRIMCCTNEEIAEEVKEESPPKYFPFAVLLVGRKIPTKILADKFQCDFWPLWEKVKTYESPDASSVFSRLSCEERDMLPAKEVSTAEFLGIADADRLYYWGPNEDIELSDETLGWLTEIRQELQIISCSIGTEESAVQFMRHMMRTFEDMRDSFGKLFAFSSMFYEFIDHSNETVYQASIHLLDRMIAQQREKCHTYEEEHGRDWNYSYFVKDQSMVIKRFLAVLANHELRNRYLWCGVSGMDTAPLQKK